jgi:hypothetical protein
VVSAGLSSTNVAEVVSAVHAGNGAIVSAELTAELETVRTRLAAEIQERQASLRLLEEVMAATCWDQLTQSA